MSRSPANTSSRPMPNPAMPNTKISNGRGFPSRNPKFTNTKRDREEKAGDEKDRTKYEQQRADDCLQGIPAAAPSKRPV